MLKFFSHAKIITISTILFFTFIMGFNSYINSEQQFAYLANSFVQGKTYFLEKPFYWSDASFFNERYYWPLGPFPAITLAPFVYIFNLLNLPFDQRPLNIALSLGVFYLVYKIVHKNKYSLEDSKFLAFAFCFSSVFLGVTMIPWSWYFAQVVCTFLIFLAFWEYLNKKRFSLIGVILGAVLLTRVTASLTIIFFVLSVVLTSKKSNPRKLSNLFKLLLPFGIAVLLLGFYNLLRFGNIFEQGYSYQILSGHAKKALGYGMFNLLHVPGNLYALILSPPLLVFKDNLSHVLKFPFIKGNPWGMSIFITSPYFFYLFFLKYKDPLSKIFIFTSIIILIPILFYYGVGFRQYGFRYSLDFLPLLFLLFIRNLHIKYIKLSLKFKLLILITSVTNLYLLITQFSYT